MTAQVVPLGRSVAERYARLMTIDFRAADRAKAIADYMDFATRLAAGGFTHADLDGMKEGMRASLIRQLSEINRV